MPDGSPDGSSRAKASVTLGATVDAALAPWWSSLPGRSGPAVAAAPPPAAIDVVAALETPWSTRSPGSSPRWWRSPARRTARARKPPPSGATSSQPGLPQDPGPASAGSGASVRRLRAARLHRLRLRLGRGDRRQGGDPHDLQRRQGGQPPAGPGARHGRLRGRGDRRRPPERPRGDRPARRPPRRDAAPGPLRPIPWATPRSSARGTSSWRWATRSTRRSDGRASASWGILANVARRLDSPAPRSRAQQAAAPPLPDAPPARRQAQPRDERRRRREPQGRTRRPDHRRRQRRRLRRPGRLRHADRRPARRAIDALRQGKEVEYGFLGIGLDEDGSNRIASADPGTPAGEGGLLIEDEILAIGDLPVVDADSLVMARQRVRARQRRSRSRSAARTGDRQDGRPVQAPDPRRGDRHQPARRLARAPGRLRQHQPRLGPRDRRPRGPGQGRCDRRRGPARAPPPRTPASRSAR